MILRELTFDRSLYTVNEARDWARAHGYRAGPVDVYTRSLRIRQGVTGKASAHVLRRTLDIGVTGAYLERRAAPPPMTKNSPGEVMQEMKQDVTEARRALSASARKTREKASSLVRKVSRKKR